jgi:hypothetical protein
MPTWGGHDVHIDDDVVFDVMGVQIDLIRENLEYASLRIKTNGTIGGGRVRVVIDIGFGDAVEPGIAELELPVLLDLPAPRLPLIPARPSLPKSFRRWSCSAVRTAA